MYLSESPTYEVVCSPSDKCEVNVVTISLGCSNPVISSAPNYQAKFIRFS